MTRDEIIAATFLRMRRPNDQTALRTEAESMINLAQSQYIERAHFIPWFMLKWSATLNNSGDQLQLPDDLLELPEGNRAFFRLDSDGNLAQRMFAEDLDRMLEMRQRMSYESELPYLFSLQSGSNLAYIGPAIPTQTFDFKLQYFAKAEPLSEGGSTSVISINSPEILIAELGIMLALASDDETAEAQFTRQLTRAQDALWRMHEKRMQGEALTTQMRYRG